MAETQRGKKFVKVHSYLRKLSNGKKIRIKAFDRSTPR